jgi:hypothetical protein
MSTRLDLECNTDNAAAPFSTNWCLAACSRLPKLKGLRCYELGQTCNRPCLRTWRTAKNQAKVSQRCFAALRRELHPKACGLQSIS